MRRIEEKRDGISRIGKQYVRISFVISIKIEKTLSDKEIFKLSN